MWDGLTIKNMMNKFDYILINFHSSTNTTKENEKIVTSQSTLQEKMLVSEMCVVCVYTITFTLKMGKMDRGYP